MMHVTLVVRVELPPSLNDLLLKLLAGASLPAATNPAGGSHSSAGPAQGHVQRRPRGRPRKDRAAIAQPARLTSDPTFDNVKAAYHELANMDGGALAIAGILRRHRLTGMHHAKPEHYSALFADLKAALEG